MAAEHPETTTRPLNVWGDEDGGFASEGHHDPEEFVAACRRWMLDEWGYTPRDIEDEYPDGIGPERVRHRWSVFAPFVSGGDEGAYYYTRDGEPVTEQTPDAIPLTTWDP